MGHDFELISNLFLEQYSKTLASNLQMGTAEDC